MVEVLAMVVGLELSADRPTPAAPGDELEMAA